jgi:nickel/cobalt transporter (NicO) family protein
MSPEITLLLSTAVTLGVLHTAVGVDHTLPFIVLGKARSWPLRRTLWVTACCGIGHVLSSVAIGALGWLLGATSGRLQVVESLRGELAGALLIAFGCVYASLGLWRLRRGQGHRHVHVHPDGTIHSHPHQHQYPGDKVLHRHEHRETLPFQSSRLVPALFVIFVLGPCEALIPLMFAPAISGELALSWLVALVFSLATIATMLTLVTAGYWGLGGRALERLAPHLNWSAGVLIALSGLGVRMLGA